MNKEIPTKKAILAIFLTAILAVSITGIAIAQSPTYYQVITSGLYSGAPSYTIFNDNGVTYAKTAYGSIAFSGATTSVLNSVAGAVETGNQVYFKAGVYTLTSTVTWDQGVSLIGEHGDADFYFPIDDTYKSYTKGGVTFIDGTVDGITMFQLGLNSSDTFGYTLKDLTFSGYATLQAWNAHKGGIAINYVNIQSSEFENIGVYHKAYGIKGYGTNDGVPLRSSDVVKMENLHFSFCERGLYVTGAGGTYNINNVYGYVNQYNLIVLANYYVITLSNVMSDADGWGGASPEDAPVYVAPIFGDARIRDVFINGGGQGYGGVAKAYNGMTLSCSPWTPHGFISVDHAIIQGTQGSAIEVLPNGVEGTKIFINDLYVGSPDGQNIAGDGAGYGDVAGAVIHAYDTETKIYVNGGYVNSTASVPIYYWFENVTSVKNLANFNGLSIPYTLIANSALGTIGLHGGTTVSASTNYTVTGCDVLATVSGGTDVLIDIFGPDGNYYVYHATALTNLLIPVGYKINFGAFSLAPTTQGYFVAP